MKHNRLISATIFMIVLVLCFTLTSCSSNSGDSTNPPAKDNSTPSDTGNQTKFDYNKVYGSLIKQWKSALNNYRNEEYSSDDMLDFSFYSHDRSSAEAYYALYDIDGNGVDELILTMQNIYEDIIAYIFSIKDGNPINIFGYNDYELHQVPWSRVGSSIILHNGLIDSMDGNYSIYKIADDGYTVIKIASEEPYNYPDMANLVDADWRYYINDTQVDYDFYVQYLSEHGYSVGEYENNIGAAIDWKNVNDFTP